MKTHGEPKASITVETALVLPIILGAVFAVLFLIVVMFQNTVQLSLLNMYALRGANNFTTADKLLNDINTNKIAFLAQGSSSGDIYPNISSSFIISSHMKMPYNNFLGSLGQGGSITSDGVAPIIRPSQYIRETDSKSAILTAYADPTIWDNRMNQFMSRYLTYLFSKGILS